MMRGPVLILGGTSEAMALARACHARGDHDVIMSLAGRTENPVMPPVPHRIGGFGGVSGLVNYLRDHQVTCVIDATHPFAAQMTRNAAEACKALAVPRLVFTRPPWQAGADDIWQNVPDNESAVEALGVERRRVFLTVGRLSLPVFRRAQHHHYLTRSIDAPGQAEMPIDSHLILARGPFSVEQELALMRDHKIDILVTKNSGGPATDAKLQAARILTCPVIMVDRPAMPKSEVTTSLEDVLAFIDHHRNSP
jgi:precorrin-6A/cobalt-precorrin-6A reductase